MESKYGGSILKCRFLFFTRGSRILKNISFYILLILITIIFIGVLKLFVFTSFSIPSSSMEPTLIPGDYILVNKLKYKPINRNDILVFNFPYLDNWNRIRKNIKSYYTKRCIAIPGDTICIEDGIYQVKNISDTLGYYPSQLILKEMNEPSLIQSGIVLDTYPWDSINYKWTIKSFGPLYIPKSGISIPIDTLNIKLYKNLIEYETDKDISIFLNIVYLDNIPIKEYSFTLNYYFMAGDYVLDSKDSRYWGLLPEDHIIGKVSKIWKSIDPATNSYRLERFLKSVN